LVEQRVRFAGVSNYRGHQQSAATAPLLSRLKAHRTIAKDPMKAAALLSFMSALLLASPARAGPDTNKQIVANFIHDVFVEKNPDAALKYLAPDYIQHNPKVSQGAEGFVRSISEWFAHAPADLSDETLHLVAEGDLVVAHQQLTYTDKSGARKAVVGFDLYRLRDGRIVEHWDSDS
jgi:predicted SnoaL-like aldol condensation-catalyzing enzyme